MLALKVLNENGVLSGVVISMDPEGPIAAKVVSIAITQHVLTTVQKELPGENPLKNDEFIDYMISEAHLRDKKRYLEEIVANTGNCFNSGTDGVFVHTSNFTTTLLKGASPSNLDLVLRELELRKIGGSKGYDIDERICLALEDFFIKGRRR